MNFTVLVSALTFLRNFWKIPSNKNLSLLLLRKPFIRKVGSVLSQLIKKKLDFRVLVQEGRRQEAEGRRNIACRVSFLAFLNGWVISAALY